MPVVQAPEVLDFDGALEAHLYDRALVLLETQEDRDYARTRFIDRAAEAFKPEALEALLKRWPFGNPVAQAMDLWGAFSEMVHFALG